MTQSFRRERGSWRYEFEHKGERYSKSGFKTRRAALLAEADHKKALAIAHREPARGDTLTLAEYVELWMADHVKPELRPRTARAYRQALDLHVLPKFGKVALADLTRAQLRAHLADLAATGLARNTIRNCVIPLRALLNCAVGDGLLETNPATALGVRVKARSEQEAAKVKCYSKDELDTILRAAEAHLPRDRADLVYTLAGAGLRLGEVLGLQLDDLADDHLWVRRNVQWQDRVAHVLAPKNGRVRRVDVTPALVARLRRERTGPYVFGGAKLWRPEPMRKAWYSLLAHEDLKDVPKLRLHDLRHTYAALLLGAGAPPSYVKEQMGHSSIQVTIDIYGHLIPGANRKWIDETFGGAA